MADHEGELFGGSIFGGKDQVAFVFARGGVEDDDEGAAFCEWGVRRVAAGGKVTGVLLNASMVSAMESNWSLETPFGCFDGRKSDAVVVPLHACGKAGSTRLGGAIVGD